MKLSFRKVKVNTEWMPHNVSLVSNEILLALVALNDYFTEVRQPQPDLPDWKLTVENEPCDGWKIAGLMIAEQRIDHILLWREVEEQKIIDFIKIGIDLGQDAPLIYQGIVRVDGEDLFSSNDVLQRQVLDVFEEESPDFDPI